MGYKKSKMFGSKQDIQNLVDIRGELGQFYPALARFGCQPHLKLKKCTGKLADLAIFTGFVKKRPNSVEIEISLGSKVAQNHPKLTRNNLLRLPNPSESVCGTSRSALGPVGTIFRKKIFELDFSPKTPILCRILYNPVAWDTKNRKCLDQSKIFKI